MKKVLLFAFAGLLSLGIQAQSFIGVKAGGGLALRMGNTGPSGFTSDPGAAITGGLVYKNQILQRMTLEGDVLIDMRLTQATLSKDVPAVSNGGMYIMVPITAQLMNPYKKRMVVPYRGEESKSYWYLEGGPYFAYGLSVDAVDPNLGEQRPNNIDLGITAGAGSNFAFSDSYTRLNVGFRGNYGFMNTYKVYADAPVLNNVSIIGYVGLDFALSKKKHFQHRW
ncbi:MAG: hypothetical protein RLZZ337_1187 [Bacteroidota bacterium]|jgi:hypothetical protein